MHHVPPVSAVMTAFPHSIDVGATLQEARAMMREHVIHHLPVKDGARLVGIISAREVELALAAAAGLTAEDELLVRAACVLDPYIVDLREPLDVVADEMARRHLGSVLVVKEGRLAGIFTTRDACHELASLLRRFFPGQGDDAA